MACALDGLTVLDLARGRQRPWRRCSSAITARASCASSRPERRTCARAASSCGTAARRARRSISTRLWRVSMRPAARRPAASGDAGGRVCAARCRCRRARRGLRAELAAAAPRGVAAAEAPQSAPRGLLDHRLRQARTLEGRAADRGSGAGAHGPPLGHARVPAGAGARRASRCRASARRCSRPTASPPRCWRARRRAGAAWSRPR